ASPSSLRSRVSRSSPTRRSSDLDLKRALRAVPAPAQRHVLGLWRHAWDIADDDVPNPPPSPLLGLRRPAASGTTDPRTYANGSRSEEHTSELQSRFDLVCRLLLE